MSLLRLLVQILLLWRPAFRSSASHKRAIRHAVAGLCSAGRGTITQLITFLGQENQDWAADYYFYSKRTWDVNDLFQPIIENALPFSHEHFIAIAVDDTKLRKTGKKIATASWQRDPMGPPFQTNLIWAQRFLHFSYLLPLYEKFAEKEVPPRSLPIRFTESAAVKKPGRKASSEELKAYKEEKKKRNLSMLFVQEAKKLRDAFNAADASNKRILFVGDNSYCNRVCFRATIENADMLARARKDAKLCFKAEEGARRFYDTKTFTPEKIRQDESIPWETIKIFHGGAWRDVQYKEIPQVYWRTGAGRRPLRLFVLRPIKYHTTKSGRSYYREPAYLLSTSLSTPIKAQVQAYFDRWQIEVNHREEKTIIGVGEAQVRNIESAHRQPAFMVAAYSSLLLSSVLAYGDQINEQLHPKAKWSQPFKRPSCQQLIAQLRKEILEQQWFQQKWNANIDAETMFRKANA